MKSQCSTYLLFLFLSISSLVAYSHKPLSKADEQRLQQIIRFVRKDLMSSSFVKAPCINNFVFNQQNSKIVVEDWFNEINRLYDYDAADCLKTLTTIAQNSKDKALVSKYAQICYLDEHGKHEEAIKVGLEALPEAKNQAFAEANIYRMLGRSYSSIGEYEASFMQFEKAIKIARQIRKPDTEVLSWVGLVGVSREIFQKDTAKVNVHIDNIKRLLPSVKNPTVKSYILVEMVLFNQNDASVAQLNRYEAIAQNIRPDSPFWTKSMFIILLSDFLYNHPEHEKDYEDFLQYYSHSMTLLPPNQNLIFNIGRSYLALADYYQAKGRYDLAQAYADTSFFYAQKGEVTAINYEVQSRIYEGKKEWKKALESMRMALKAYEKEYLKRNNEVVSRNERKFYTKEKELKLALANEENEQKEHLLWILGISTSLLAAFAGIIFWQNRKVKKANILVNNQAAELVVLMKEAHHRVKNNLQMVSAILYMQANASKDKEAIEALLNAEGRLKTIALVHESLYKSENVAKINLNEYLSELVKNLAKQAIPSFDFKIHVQTELITSLDAAIPIGLIINELITNSIKYAFKNQMNGFIEIVLEKTDDNFNSIKYRDNGEGFPNGKLPDAKTSLGIRLIKIFVQQLKGTLEYDQTNGVEFKLKFKNL